METGHSPYSLQHSPPFSPSCFALRYSSRRLWEPDLGLRGNRNLIEPSLCSSLFVYQVYTYKSSTVSISPMTLHSCTGVSDSSQMALSTHCRPETPTRSREDSRFYWRKKFRHKRKSNFLFPMYSQNVQLVVGQSPR